MRARDLCQAVKAMHEAEADQRRRTLSEPFGAGGGSVWIQLPFFCDYRTNIEMVERVLLNYKWVMLDACRVKVDWRSIRDFAQCARPPKPTSNDIR